MSSERWGLTRPLHVSLIRPISLPVAVAVVALTYGFSPHLMGQSPGRRTVPVTLVQTPFADSAIAAVISPQPDGSVRILLPLGATPEQLLTAVAVLDSRRLPLAPTGQPSKAIVINRVVIPRLPAALEARLRARLTSLTRQEVRELDGVGQVRSITIPISLARPR